MLSPRSRDWSECTRCDGVSEGGYEPVQPVYGDPRVSLVPICSHVDDLNLNTLQVRGTAELTRHCPKNICCESNSCFDEGFVFYTKLKQLTETPSFVRPLERFVPAGKAYSELCTKSFFAYLLPPPPSRRRL